jgi:hypothetical protein
MNSKESSAFVSKNYIVKGTDLNYMGEEPV